MTAVDQAGFCTIALTSGDSTVSVRIANLKPTATDADIYSVAAALVLLLDLPLASITRSERTLLNA